MKYSGEPFGNAQLCLNSGCSFCLIFSAFNSHLLIGFNLNMKLGSFYGKQLRWACLSILQ